MDLVFRIGTRKPKKLTKKEKVKRLSKNPVYNANNFPQYLPLKFVLPMIPFYSVTQKRESWKIPKTIRASLSVESKFITISQIFSYRTIVSYIKDSLRRIRFKIPYINEKDKWEPPKEIKSQITSYYAKQENEWNKVRGIYFKLFKFKELITPLVYTWKIRAAIRNIKNVEDPVTLEIPKKPVYVIDINRKISFVYDARVLRKTIEERLLFSDYMFAEPQVPINLLTNEPLTYGQILSIVKQCREYGESSWLLDELKTYGTNLKQFTTFNKQRLNLEAVNTFFKKSTYVMRETIVDFFVQEADYADLPRHKVTGFIRRYDMEPTNGLVKRWIKNTKEYYIAKELNNPVMLQKNEIDTETLLNAIHLSIF